MLIALLESVLAFKFLSQKSSSSSFKYIMVTAGISNLVSFFMEYYLFIFLNGGHRTLVWIPWVKIIGTSEITIYLISFPIIFMLTVLIEFIISAFLLKKKYKWKQVLKAIFLTNLISTIVLIVIFNCIVFNKIKGQEEGSWDSILPQIEKRKPN